MRHNHGYRKLGRTSSHRKSLLKNLAISLIEHGKIETTIMKAKELRPYIEKLITKSKPNGFNEHRYVYAYLQNKEATKKLVTEISQKYLDKKGGYTKIVRTRIRRGDATVMARIELI